jgi:hypothetical protein
MHPSIHYEIMKTRVADWQTEADQDRLAQTADRARRARQRPSRPGALARRLLAATRLPGSGRPAI